MYAAASGDKEITSYLIDKGADVTADDKQGNTVVSAAKESKNLSVIALIEEKLKN